MTRGGIPVWCWVWPGHTADMSVVKQFKKDLVDWKLGRVISVLDRGFVSEENVKELQRTGGHYIISEKLRGNKESVQKALSTADQHGKRACQLLSHSTYNRYLKLLKNGRVKVDRAKVKAEEKHDGKYLLRTSDDTLRPEDVALGYKQLLEVEAAFRTLKSTLDLRPVYHRLEERIRAHVLVCWLALLLIRIAERRHRGYLGEDAQRAAAAAHGRVRQ